jgi:YVTN family beta-propeller protein
MRKCTLLSKTVLKLRLLIALLASMQFANAQVITFSVPKGIIHACAGNASVTPYVQQFTASGTGLRANLTVTAPANFEVSTTPTSGYASSITLIRSGSTGIVASTVVYVRSAATAAEGTIAGNITLSSTVFSTLVPIIGNVNATPTVNTITSQTLCSGAATTAVNFTGTASSYSWVNNNTGIGLAASGTGDIPAFTATNTGSTALTATVTVTPTKVPMAYVGNLNDATLSVVNMATNTAVATLGIDITAASVSPDGSKVYVVSESADPGNGTMSVINTATNTVIATVAVGDAPSGVSVSPDGTKVYVTNKDFDNVSVINMATNTVVATVNVGDQPYGVSVSADGMNVYVVNKGTYGATGTVSVINTANNMVEATVTVGTNPQGLAVSPDGTKVYVANGGTYSIYSTVSVISTSSNTVVATVGPMGLFARGISISPDGTKVYVTTRDGNGNYGLLSVINTANYQYDVFQVTNSLLSGVSVSADGTKVYVVDAGDGNVGGIGNISVINTANNSVLTTIPVGSFPITYGNFITNVPTTCTGGAQTFTITVNPLSNASIATVNKTQTLPVTGITYFSNSCTDSLIAKLSPNGASPVSGNTTAKVWIETTQPSQFVKRHYEITPATGAATATSNVTLYFTQAEFNDFNALNAVKLPTGAADASGIANLLIEKRSGISSDGTGLPATYTGSTVTLNPVDADIIWNATQGRWEVSFNVVGFSGFFVKTLSGVLPSNLINFTGNKTSNGHLIQWQTSNEINTKSFELERNLALGSTQWVTIASQLAVGNGANSYSYVDVDKLDGTILYRLKMMDVDGSYKHSNVIKFTDQLRNQTIVYPNPVTNKATLEIGDRKLLNTQAKMIDANGRIIKTILIKNSFEIIDMSGLPNGLYTLKMANGSSLKIIKNKK